MSSTDISTLFGKKPVYPVLIKTADGRYETIMTRHPGSLLHQSRIILESMYTPGRSKHADKDHNHGKPARNRIYMDTTLATYTAHCARYAHWLNRSERLFSRAQDHVGPYLRFLIDNHYSPNTIKTAAAALGKAYYCSIPDFGVQLPKRHRADRDFSAKNQKVIDFYKKNPRLCLAYLACGLRKNKELAKITCDDFRFNDGTGHIVGKNGRPRRFSILPGLDYLVEDFVHQATAEGRRKPFCKIPKDAPVHHLRRMYACLWYLHLARPIDEVPRTERYYCKAELAGLWLDRTALLQVSSWLGHQRPDVTVAYIAPFAERDDNDHLHIINPLTFFPGVENYFKF